MVSHESMVEKQLHGEEKIDICVRADVAVSKKIGIDTH
jgi:hypothetical protein